MTGIIVDGVLYHVYVEYGSLKRDFEIMEGRNSGTAITGRSIRDILGTGYKYSMNIIADSTWPQDYDSFYEAISAPVDFHSVVMPYGQETLTFDAKIISGSDVYDGVENNFHYWKALSVTFEPMGPQRT